MMTLTPPAHSQSAAVDAFLAAVLRGDAILADQPEEVADLVVRRAAIHGVTALVFGSPAGMAALPVAAQRDLRAQALAAAMWDLQHRQVLGPLFAALAGAGVRAVLLKGEALAGSVYGDPAQRPRGDTDLLIALSQRETARNTLTQAGFVRSSPHEADRMLQEEWEAEAPDGTAHAVDLHWNLLRPWALSRLFDTQALIDAAVPLPRLGPAALGLPAHLALLHACLHRASHFSGVWFSGVCPA
jgi:hypothetical protein